MPRRSRIVVPSNPLHIIQRGNNRQACFFSDEDYLIYLQWLKEYALISGCLIHSFVLMTNHVHLLLTPQRKNSPGDLLKRLGQRYVQYINRTYKRTGTLWEGRFRSCLIQEEKYLLTCQRYIELNPVRANIVKYPGDFQWSSYGSNGQGKKCDLISPHPLYQALGKTEEEKQSAYRELFRYDLESGEIDKIRKATNGNFAVGARHFQEEISEMLGRRVFPGKAGRPKKKTQQKQGLSPILRFYEIYKRKTARRFVGEDQTVFSDAGLMHLMSKTVPGGSDAKRKGILFYREKSCCGKLFSSLW